ncbi:MAG: hypothetical protein LC689_04170, partial [Myxococcales bacterium]|nr:hypothetical protein [Myxococcales bacterium]
MVALAVGCGKTTGSQTPADGGTGSSGASQHTLHMRVTGNGQVTSTSPSFSCRGDCQQSVDATATVHLSAVADSGWKFDGWQGACSGAGNCDVAMNADRDVTASFSTVAPPPAGSVRVTVTFVGNGSGRAMSSPAAIDCPGVCSAAVTKGTLLSFSAQPDANSSFTGWGGDCHGNGSCGITANSDVAIFV